jgi:hypothetical protein
MKRMYLIVLTFMVLFASCSSKDSDPFTISASQISMTADGTQTLTASEAATWTSESEFVATVSAAGLVTGQHVGETTIRAAAGDKAATCKVNVVPVYYTYTEPILDFTADKATIKSKEKRTLKAEEETSLAFIGENGAAKLVMYLFDDNGKLKSAGVIVSLNRSLEVTDFLLERYQPIGISDGVFYYINDVISKATVTIGENVGDNYILIIYVPHTSTKSSETNADLFRQMRAMLPK